MTDPLDALRHTTGATAPDPEFRARLMAELADALAGHPPVEHASRRSVPDPDTPTVMEISMDTSSRTRWTRRALPVAAGLAVVAVIVAALAVSQDRDVDTAAAVSTTAAVAEPAASSQPPLSPGAPTPLADAAIAEAGLLTYQDIDFIGGGWTPGFGEIGFMDSANAATVPSCGPFVDIVFENDDRPATIRKQTYGQLFAMFEQDVVVFPTVGDAMAMMDAVSDPAFPACWADFGVIAMNALTCCEDATLEPVAPHQIREFGDEMVNLAFSGEVVADGRLLEGDGPVVFVRVGRAVMFINPPSPMDTGEPGYSDEQVEQFLAISVAKLRAAQEV